VSKLLLPFLFHGLIFTFDDGPNTQNTGRVLDVLKKHRVHAVFCVVAANLSDTKHVDLSKRAIREGHLICNHSVTHPDFSKISKARQVREVARANQIIKQKLGVKPVFFRPPSGVVTGTMLYALRYHGLKLFMWDIDSKDWHPRTSMSRIYSRVISRWKRRRCKNSIVLFHDVNARTVKVLEKIILRVKRETKCLRKHSRSN